MGFKSRVRKRRGNTGKGTPEDGDSEEYEGQIRCDIIECGNWADKKIGGRKMAYDRAVEVWGASGVSRKVRKVSLCKPCYRTWKKEKKGEPKEWVSKGKGALGNAPPHFHASQKFRSAVRKNIEYGIGPFALNPSAFS